jgi:hypothetical protein
MAHCIAVYFHKIHPNWPIHRSTVNQYILCTVLQYICKFLYMHIDISVVCVSPVSSWNDAIQIEKEKIARLRPAAIAIGILYALYFIQCVLCMVIYAFNCMHCTQCIILYALHSMHCILCIAFYALHSMYCILCTVLYALYAMHCMLCIVFYALYSMHCIL